jgi:16S rRNA (adenine1518-N6/adenine1519-N6)-dimethyltransferase
MKDVRAKKHLGQHFLKDESIARKIAETIFDKKGFKDVLEIGPGMGVMTKYLLDNTSFQTWLCEIDDESVEYLLATYPEVGNRIMNRDFLKMNLDEIFDRPFGLIGNYPYNISSQIVFKVLDFKSQIPFMSGMFQMEVAERICSGPDTKKYGVISVLAQAYYDCEYLFTVDANVFNPPPKVQSGVMRMTRREKQTLDCDEKLFKQVVKTTFNMRRKTVRNGLKTWIKGKDFESDFLQKRPENLSWQDFVILTNQIDKLING